MRKRPLRETSVVKPKPTSNLFLKVYVDEPEERFEEVGKMVSKKQLRWAYYGIDDNRGCHFYKKLKKIK